MRAGLFFNENNFMILSTKIKGIVLIFSLVFFIQCYNSPDVKERDGTKIETLNEKDAKVLGDTYEEGLFEMRLADTVKQHAAFDKTRQLAMMLSDLHSDLNAQLVNLAGQKSVVLPGDIEPTQLQTLNKLSKIKGTAFDKAYIDTAMARHKKNIALYQGYIKSCSDSTLIVYFKTATPLFQKYLDMAVVMPKKR